MLREIQSLAQYVRLWRPARLKLRRPNQMRDSIQFHGAAYAATDVVAYTLPLILMRGAQRDR